MSMTHSRKPLVGLDALLVLALLPCSPARAAGADLSGQFKTVASDVQRSSRGACPRPLR